MKYDMVAQREGTMGHQAYRSRTKYIAVNGDEVASRVRPRRPMLGAKIKASWWAWLLCGDTSGLRE